MLLLVSFGTASFLFGLIAYFLGQHILRQGLQPDFVVFYGGMLFCSKARLRTIAVRTPHPYLRNEESGVLTHKRWFATDILKLQGFKNGPQNFQNFP
jgi:hypothetical protein